MLFSAVVREEVWLEAVGHWYPNSRNFLVTCSVPLDLLSYPNSCLSPRTSSIWPPMTKVAAYWNHAHSGTSFSFHPVIPLLALSVFLLLSLFLLFPGLPAHQPLLLLFYPSSPQNSVSFLSFGNVRDGKSASLRFTPASMEEFCTHVHARVHECAPARLCLCTCLYCEERNRYCISPRRSQRCKSFVGLKGPTRLC